MATRHSPFIFDMKDYSHFPNPFLSTDPIHPDPLWEKHYGCRTRGLLLDTVFDPRCKDCVDAAIGFLDAGQDTTREMSRMYFNDGTYLAMSLLEFVEWVQYYKGAKV